MMLSISSGHSANYLTDQVGQGRESYYTGAVDAGEPAGRWVGAGAALLGLEGAVDPDVMHHMYSRYADPRDPAFADPRTRGTATTLGAPPRTYRTPDQVVAEKIAAYPGTPMPEQVRTWQIEAERGADRSAVMFLDATYSPPKSVTVLHTALEAAATRAEAAGDLAAAARFGRHVRAIDEAIQVANDVMLSHLADVAGYARTGKHGAASSTGRWVDAHDLTIASFYQHTSRDLDPQLHVHNAILNRVPCPDGKWRALDSRALHHARQGAGTLAARALEVELTARLGVLWQMRSDGLCREILGIDEAAMELFSSRATTLGSKAADDIAAAEAHLGRTLSSKERDDLRRAATMATRRAKTHDGESRAESLDRWDAELSTKIAGGLARIAETFAHAGTLTPNRPGAPFDPAQVIAQAVEAAHSGTAGDGRATWGRSELIRQILLALPDDLGSRTGAQVVDLANHLADQALADTQLAVQTTGREIGTEPATSRLNNGRAATIAPGSARFAGRGHCEAEIALIKAAQTRAGHALDPKDLATWRHRTDRPGHQLSTEQAAAVTSLACTDAAISVLIGPAGTGKSFTAGTLAAAWGDLSAGGRVMGVATAQLAANVLADDGIPDTSNIAAFLAAQQRLARQSPRQGDQRWQLGPNDLLVVDEASMVDTGTLTRLRHTADAAGARIVLMGDPEQLGAIGAGGMMPTLTTAGAHTVTLADVRRFTAPWERAASLALRDGTATVDPTTSPNGRATSATSSSTGTASTSGTVTPPLTSAAQIADLYDRNGRLIDAGSHATAVHTIADAAAADLICGLDTLVITPSNADASSISTLIRDRLIAAGKVTEDGVILGRDGCTAGVGDLIAARRIDHQLGLTNRATYRITATHPDGSLTAIDTRTSKHVTIPPAYVETDLALAYAGTAHAAQGQTVDTAHALLAPGTSRAHAYVAMTRGRDRNTAYAVTCTGAPTPHQGPGPHPSGQSVLQQTTAAAVLTDILDRTADTTGDSATTAHHAQTTHRTSAATLLALIEDETHLAARARLETDLDNLVAAGLITADDRARFATDQGTAYLAQLLRVHELGGTNPTELLRQAVTHHDFRRVLSVAQVVAGRIDKNQPLPVPLAENLTHPQPRGSGPAPSVYEVPAGTTQDRAQHLTDLHQRLAARENQLGIQLADLPPTDVPAWVTTTLGPAPAHDAPPSRHHPKPGDARADWIRRAGIIAAYREATTWSETTPFGRAPGPSLPERRAAWHRAYLAAGMPETRRVEADLTDGRLLVRIAAAKRVLAHAPAYVDDDLKAAHLAHQHHTHQQILNLSRADHTTAATHEAAARAAQARIDLLTPQSAARAHWLATTIETREAGRAAQEEYTRRTTTVTAAGTTPNHGHPTTDLTTEAEDTTGPATPSNNPADPTDPAADEPPGEDPTDQLTGHDLPDHDVTDPDPLDPDQLDPDLTQQPSEEIPADSQIQKPAADRDGEGLPVLEAPHPDQAHDLPSSDLNSIDLNSIDMATIDLDQLNDAQIFALGRAVLAQHEAITDDLPVATPQTILPPESPEQTQARNPRETVLAGSVDRAAEDEFTRAEHEAILTAFRDAKTARIQALTQLTNPETPETPDPPEQPEPTPHAAAGPAGATPTESAGTVPPGRITALNAAAWDYYTHQAATNPAAWATTYHTGRLPHIPKLPADLGHTHTIGYAPNAWTALADHLRSTYRATDTELIAAGLAKTVASGDRIIDAFRDRAILPLIDKDAPHPDRLTATATGHKPATTPANIHPEDTSPTTRPDATPGPSAESHEPVGPIVGFIGRRNPTCDHNPDPTAGPKYLNTKTTSVYRKSSHLFGADLLHAYPDATPVIVEGPYDALAVTVASGGEYVGVAPLGTALTTEHLSALDAWIRPTTPTECETGTGRPVVVACDNDEAGRRASLSAYYAIAARGGTTRALALPDGADPADLAHTSPDTFRTQLQDAPDMADVLLAEQHERHQNADWAHEKALALKTAAGIIAATPPAQWDTRAHEQAFAHDEPDFFLPTWYEEITTHARDITSHITPTGAPTPTTAMPTANAPTTSADATATSDTTTSARLTATRTTSPTASTSQRAGATRPSHTGYDRPRTHQRAHQDDDAFDDIPTR